MQPKMIKGYPLKQKLTIEAKTLAAKSKSRRLNPHLNKTCRCAAGKNNVFSSRNSNI